MANTETYMEAFISVVEEMPLNREIIDMVRDFCNDNEVLVPANISICDIKTHCSKEIYGIKITVSFLAIKK